MEHVKQMSMVFAHMQQAGCRFDRRQIQTMSQVTRLILKIKFFGKNHTRVLFNPRAKFRIIAHGLHCAANGFIQLLVVEWTNVARRFEANFHVVKLCEINFARVIIFQGG